MGWLDSERYGSGLLLGGWRKDWHTIWLMFAGYALFLAVIFFFGFKYNHDPEKDNASFSYIKGFAALFLGAAFMIKVN